MIRATYKGQQIRTARGAKKGTVKPTVNGHVLDDRYGIEEDVVRSIKGAIDLLEERVAQGRAGASWYIAPERNDD